ncbi:MAG: hypothetical protein AB7U35_03420 [Sphingobium sp.]
MHKVTISRTYLARTLLLAFLLLWPLLLTGKPAYMLDSAYYQNGGKTAVTFVAKKLHINLPSAQQPAARPAAGAAQGEDKIVARSIVYSVLGYALNGPGVSMIYLALFQALCVALVVVALFMALAGPSTRAFVFLTVVLVGGTGLAPVATFILPDCFAGIMVGTLAVLPFYWRRFSPVLLFLLVMAAIASVTVHASHPPVAAGMAVLATFVILLLRQRGQRGARRVRLAILWLPVVAGVAATMLTGLIGFGQVSIAPKSFPLALARGLDNGPANWYLKDVCAKDRHAYAMCEVYGTDIPDDVDRFLFKPGNVVNRATPEQLDRIRAEEKEILVRTTLRYPLHQAYIVLRDVPDQFISFELDYLFYDGRLQAMPNGKVVLFDADSGNVPPLIGLLSILDYAAVLASLALLAWSWRRLTFEQRGVVLIVLSGLLANAAVCAIFSGVAPRYQARIVWLLPLVAIAFARDWSGGGWQTLGKGKA